MKSPVERGARHEPPREKEDKGHSAQQRCLVQDEEASKSVVGRRGAEKGFREELRSATTRHEAGEVG